MTVPAMVAMPQAMTMNISPRLSSFRYGRIRIGASVMPTKMLAAAQRPTAPPTPRLRSRHQARARTISGRMRQWNNSAESALTTRMSGRARNARMKLAPGWVTSKGAGPPPK
jgi:hypothetical protein